MPIFRVKKSSDIIPVGTVLVVVENKKIGRLPSLPDSLTSLYCYDCTSLHELPSLPISLTRLECFRCTSLCKLPPLLHCVGLTQLDCHGCTSLRELPPLPVSLTLLYCSATSLLYLPPLLMGLKWLNCIDCTSLLYLPIIPHTCEYNGPSLPTEKKYFEEVNMGKNQEFIASRGDKLLYRIIGKDITYIVKGYLS
jgi:hypothetical protein